MEILEIMKYLPHRYPFLLVDKIINTENGETKKIIGLKNVTINEHFFQGHFPGDPIMPGVLIIEGMAQCGGILVIKELLTEEERKNSSPYFAAIDNVKFRKPVRPGDQIRYEIDIINMKKTIAKMRGKAFVGDDLVCEAEMTAIIAKRQ